MANNDSEKTSVVFEDLDWQKVIINDTSELVELQTWRGDGNPEAKVQENLGKINKIFVKKMNEYNKGKSEEMKMSQFEWNDEKDGNQYRVFRFRVGQGKRKVALICHLDTVPPGDGWDPFHPKVELRVYNGTPVPFLIGRGAIDDKGPAVVAFEALRRALEQANASEEAREKLKNDLTLEVLLDTSEETDMSTPNYFIACPEEKPSFGIVFDAYWTVRAEKGIARPAFSISASDVPENPSAAVFSIDKLSTPSGPVNMIPVTAEARIKGSGDLKDLSGKIETWYQSCQFDDLGYHPAEIRVELVKDDKQKPTEVVITAKVSGGQHGSTPHQNRANGANPVVSLTNFLAYLVDRNILANNYNGEMCRFIRWAFGTRVFGENHPDLLYRFDSVFSEGNGTTYALTQLDSTAAEIIKLKLDVRYTIGHHSKGWDGSEGKISNLSLFDTIFQALIKRYQDEASGLKVNVTLKGEDGKELEFGPDIRSTRNPDLLRINMAYRSIMGEEGPMRITGGATDAHGETNLFTAGALFSDNLGPPVNYHGIDEGAPVLDLENSGKILLCILQKELGLQTAQESNHLGCHHGSSDRCCCI